MVIVEPVIMDLFGRPDGPELEVSEFQLMK